MFSESGAAYLGFLILVSFITVALTIVGAVMMLMGVLREQKGIDAAKLQRIAAWLLLISNGVPLALVAVFVPVVFFLTFLSLTDMATVIMLVGSVLTLMHKPVGPKVTLVGAGLALIMQLLRIVTQQG